jgi:hypothetical protein
MKGLIHTMMPWDELFDYKRKNSACPLPAWIKVIGPSLISLLTKLSEDTFSSLLLSFMTRVYQFNYWVPTGIRTLTESSTSSSANHYTIGTIVLQFTEANVLYQKRA